MTANGSKDIDEVLFFGQRRFYAELYLSNNPEERRVRRCIGPTGSIDRNQKARLAAITRRSTPPQPPDTPSAPLGLNASFCDGGHSKKPLLVLF